MSLQEFNEVLQAVTEGVYHFNAPQEPAGEYIVWQETGLHSLYASNVRRETIKRIRVELYTEEEYSETIGKLLTILEQNEIAFQDPVSDYDRDTEKIRYSVECEVL